MESKANYTAVGTIVLILAASLLVAGIWLSAGFDHKTYHHFTVYATESVSGLGDDSAVKYNGVRVGFVSQIDVDPLHPQSVRLTLSIEEGTPVTISTYATLSTQGITGSTYLNLTSTTPSIIPLQKVPGEPYPVIPYQPSFFYQLEDTIKEISRAVKDLLDKENVEAVKVSLRNIESFTDVLATNKKNFDEFIKALPTTVHAVNHAIDEFDVMANNMAIAGNEVTLTMRSARNSVNKITQLALPPAITFLDKANQIAANLENVSSQMRQNPSVVIRGTSTPPLGPGE